MCFKYNSFFELSVHDIISIHILDVPHAEWTLLETDTWQYSAQFAIQEEQNSFLLTKAHKNYI